MRSTMLWKSYQVTLSFRKKLFCQGTDPEVVMLGSGYRETIFLPTESNRFDSVGKKIVSLYPDPNITTSGSVPWQNNFFLNDNVTWYDFHNIVERIDHNFSEKERISARMV